MVTRLAGGNIGVAVMRNRVGVVIGIRSVACEERERWY
jgi:hypothetical protein